MTPIANSKTQISIPYSILIPPNNTEINNDAIKALVKEKLITEKLGKNLLHTHPKTPHLHYT